MLARVALLTLSAALPLLRAQQKPKAEIQEIRATGCVRRAAESQCLMLETLDGSATYSFIAAPRPALNSVITIQGKSHQGRSACRQGIPIDVADWQPTGEMCVEPKSKTEPRP
jgi:hypothetical protein